MSIAGLTLPHLSEFDPPTAGEGSLDPVGLGSVSERLAEMLVPGFRARMSRFRLLTAIAIASAVCEDTAPELASDERTTPQVAFEWMLLEAFARHTSADAPLRGVPGLQKARVVRGRGERLSANSYLKGPKIFGFHGVYKPLAIELGIIDAQLQPGPLQEALVQAWEHDNGLDGFLYRDPDTKGGRLRRDLALALRRSLEKGRSDLAPTGESASLLRETLHPDTPGAREQSVLRNALLQSYPLRSELAGLLTPTLAEPLTEQQVLKLTQTEASDGLRQILDAIDAYETFARILTVVFRTLCHVSGTLGTAALTPDTVSDHPNLVRAASELPAAHQAATQHLATIGVGIPEMEGRFAVFASPLPTRELAEAILELHNSVQASKPPLGKRPWFESYDDGLAIRPGYTESVLPLYDGPFIHPIRIGPLRNYLLDTTE